MKLIVFMALLSCLSISSISVLFSHMGAQYLVLEYTYDKAVVYKTWALAIQDNLAISSIQFKFSVMSLKEQQQISFIISIE